MPIPVLITAPTTFEAKANFVLSRLGLEPAGNSKGLGVFYSPADQRRFMDMMEQNLVRELV